MAVLGVDQKFVFGGEGAFGHRIDGVRPHHDFGFVVGTAIGEDQVPIPFAVAEHHQAIR